jgi:THO complex subunit 2
MKSLLQVIKIKGDEREDLKVLATGVAAALASRKVFFFYLSYSSFSLSMTSKLETFVAPKKPETFFFYEIVMLSP